MRSLALPYPVTFPGFFRNSHEGKPRLPPSKEARQLAGHMSRAGNRVGHQGQMLGL